MLRTLLLSLVLASSVALALPAEQPMVLVHTGYLLDANDQPVSEPAEAMTFRLFDQNAPVDTEHKLWEGSCTVAVDQGHYAVALGKDCGTNLLPSMLPTDEPRYLEVSVGTTRLLPRMLVGTVPTAAVATNALAVGGESLDDLDARYARFQADPATPQAGSLALTGAFASGSIATTGDANVGGSLTATGTVSAGSLATTGDANVGGKLAASALAGDGSALTNLDASQLAAGTIPDGRISGTQSSAVSFSNPSNTFSGSFAGAFTGTLGGSGAAITGLNADGLASGTVADARLPSDVARLGEANAFTAAQTISSGAATALTLQGSSTLLSLFPDGADGSSLQFTTDGAVGSSGAFDYSIDVGYPYSTGWRAGPRLNLLRYVDGDTVFATDKSGAALGRVGIGTTTPQATLDVAGSLRAQSLKVNDTPVPVCGIFRPSHTGGNGCSNECQNFSQLAKAAGWNSCVPRDNAPFNGGGRQFYLDHACTSAVGPGYTYYETRFASLDPNENTAAGDGALYLVWQQCNDITPSFWCCQ